VIQDGATLCKSWRQAQVAGACPPGFTGFLQRQAGVQKKKQPTAVLCTLVASTLTLPLRHPLEVEASREIKIVAGLPDGDSNVSPGTLFTDVQALENNVKVANPLASGL
jgi:hypothetical protein